MVESAFLRIGRDQGWESARVLDLYAGSGALGIEALSRGADGCDFVEVAPRACATIRENLRRIGLETCATVHCQSVGAALTSRRLRPAYDVVLMDPPYADPEVADVAAAVMASAGIGSAAIVVVEHSGRVTLADGYGKLRRLRHRVHGETAISLYGPFDDQVPAVTQADGEAEREIDKGSLSR